MVLSSYLCTVTVHMVTAETAPVATDLCTKPVDLSHKPAVTCWCSRVKGRV